MRSPSLFLAVIVTLLVPAADTSAQNGPPADAHPRVREAMHLLDTWLQAKLEYDDIPGISVGVVHDQDLVWSAGYGYADVAARRPATPETIYSICSISKLFTAIAVLQQRDAGRLRLDDPVSQHLPWFRIEERYEGGAPVRIEGLLTHSSGLPRESAFPYWSGPDFRFPTREEMQARVAEQSTLYPAERWYQYSNLGLSLAGEVVMATVDMSFDAYVRANILDPLGMKHTTTDIPAAERGRGLATGYGRRMPGAKRDALPFYTVNGIAPAAGFASNVVDLARFASWQFRLLRDGGSEILDANTLREMQRVHWTDPDLGSPYGLGFSIWREGGDTFVGHGGSCPGYQTQLALHPSDRIAAIAMVNATGVSAGAIANRAYRIMAPALERAAADTSATRKQEAPAVPLEPYFGYYRGFWGDAAVLQWEGQLAILSLPTDNPLDAITRLRHVEGHTFERVRTGEEIPGEEITFEIGPDGRATRMVRNSNPMVRVEG
jgi:CubicO group peptidase (beta-lactamase class C family)